MLAGFSRLLWSEPKREEKLSIDEIVARLLDGDEAEVNEFIYNMASHKDLSAELIVAYNQIVSAADKYAQSFMPCYNNLQAYATELKNKTRYFENPANALSDIAEYIKLVGGKQDAREYQSLENRLIDLFGANSVNCFRRKINKCKNHDEQNRRHNNFIIRHGERLEEIDVARSRANDSQCSLM